VTRRRVVLAVLGAVLVVALTRAVWVWTHPTLLKDRTFSSELELPLKPVGTRAHTAIVVPAVNGHADETITFSKPSVRFETNTARATTSFSICVPRAGYGVVGAAFGDPKKFCRSIRPLRDGTTMHWVDGDPPRAYLLLTVTTHHTGKAILDRVSIGYSRTWKHAKQHGSSHVPVRITVRAG